MRHEAPNGDDFLLLSGQRHYIFAVGRRYCEIFMSPFTKNRLSSYLERHCSHGWIASGASSVSSRQARITPQMSATDCASFLSSIDGTEQILISACELPSAKPNQWPSAAGWSVMNAITGRLDENTCRGIASLLSQRTRPLKQIDHFCAKLFDFVR
jgi:hypothetical protein